MALRSTVKVIDRTREAFRRIEKSSHDTLVDFCQKAQTVAANQAPFDTGNLRDSIDWERTRALMFRLFTATNYGAYVELGTSRMAAQPFIAPAIAETVDEFHRGNKWGLR